MSGGTVVDIKVNNPILRLEMAFVFVFLRIKWVIISCYLVCLLAALSVDNSSPVRILAWLLLFFLIPTKFVMFG